MHLRFIFLMALLLPLALFAQALPQATDVGVQYKQGDLELERTLEIRPAPSVYATTGAMVQAYESIITLKVKNAATGTKQNLVLEEDLSYLPPNAKIRYAQTPDYSDGIRARWKIGSLPAGKYFEASFSLPAIVPAQKVKALPAPKIYYEKNGYAISAPQEAGRGEGITLQVKDETGANAQGTMIRVKYPDGRESVVATGKDGQVKILAEDAGIYIFELQDGSASAKTNVVVKAAANETIAPIKADESKATDSGFNIIGAIFSILPIAIGAIVIIAILYSIYKYLTIPVEDEIGSPRPVAPATKTPSQESLDGEMQKAYDEAKGLGAPDEEKDGKKVESYPVPPMAQSDEEIGESTRSLLDKRRRAGQERQMSSDGEQTIVYEPPHSAFEENTVGEREEALAQDGEKGRMQGDESSEEGMEGKTQDGYSSGEEKEEIFEGESSAGDEDDAGFKNEDIDDEAIQKTIAELEQLRAQLKSGMGGENAGLGEEADEAPDEEVSGKDIEQLIEETEQEIQKPRLVAPTTKESGAQKMAKQKPAKAYKSKAGKKAAGKGVKEQAINAGKMAKGAKEQAQKIGKPARGAQKKAGKRGKK